MDYKKKIEDLAQVVLSQGASDLHLRAGAPPYVRVAGELTPLISETPLTSQDMEGIMSALLSPENKTKFLQTKEADFSWEHAQARFRGNAYFARGVIGIALRLIPRQIKTLTELNLPPILESFANKQQGFFLVVGPVGQGKTTTLAAMLELINQNRAEHIITIEDPIEYIFDNKKSIIEQCEVRIDTSDFQTALQSVFREDVDVLMIGEMRTPETMATAVSAAETGHLVLSTLHTNNAAQTIDRIIDSFTAVQQDQIRIQLAASLAGIFSQRLLPRISGGLIPVYELLINNEAIANLIREKRSHEIPVIIETASQEGMIDMNRSLAQLVKAGEITVEAAYQHSLNPKILEKHL